MRKKQIIALIACMIVGIAGFTGVYLSEQSEKEQQAKQQEENSQVAVEEKEQDGTEVEQIASAENQESIGSQEDKMNTAAENHTTAQISQNTKENQAENLQTAQEEEQTVETAKENTLHFTPEEGLTWPLEGNVLLNYSMDSTIYFPTLDQYRYNPAIVISGAVNSKVKLIAKGEIKEIFANEETGCTVVQDLGDGYQAVYGQLKEVNFEVGDLVEQGQVIGYVSEPTKYYSKEGANLYFAIQKDGEAVNPLEYFE